MHTVGPVNLFTPQRIIELAATSDGDELVKIQPIALALTAGAGFVAKGFSGNQDQLSGLIVEAMSYKGFAMIDILQPCVSFNKINTHLWYKERVFDLAPEHDVTDFQRALALSLMDEEKIPTGIIYKKESSCFHE